MFLRPCLALWSWTYEPSTSITQPRSGRSGVFLGKGVLKIRSKFTGENPCRSAISIKLLCNFIEVTILHGSSPVNLLHIFRTHFLNNTSRWLLLSQSFISNLLHFFRERDKTKFYLTIDKSILLMYIVYNVFWRYYVFWRCYSLAGKMVNMALQFCHLITLSGTTEKWLNVWWT